MRGEPGESLAAVQKFDVPLEQATTSSLDALQAYSLGRKANNEARAAEEQRWFAGKPEYAGFGLVFASDTEAYAGHLGQARKLARRAVDSAVRADNKENGALWQANAALQQAAYGDTVERDCRRQGL
jgi:hypothetical protein